MSNYREDYALDAGYSHSESMAAERIAFIKRTYAHLGLALLAFTGILMAMYQIEPLKEAFGRFVFGGRWNFLFLMIAFIVFGSLAQNWAQSTNSLGTQYAGLFLYVFLEAIIVFPLIIFAADVVGDKSLPGQAAVLTLAAFGGLTAVVFVTKKDFSFLRSALTICSFLALGVIICALIFGFGLGTFFALAMIALMCGYILYYTSNIMQHYNTNQHVAAALALFAAVATLFYYILYYLILTSRE